MAQDPSPYQLRRERDAKFSLAGAVVSVSAVVLLIMVTFQAYGY